MNLGKRIMILGSSGSGKSTLAKKLGEKTGCPVIHLDCLYWLPDWIARDNEEVDKLILDEAERETWIMDGNYSRTMDIRMQKADTVIFIDLNRFFCIYRIIKRRIAYRNKNREDITAGCYEKIDKKFLSWVWNYPKRARRKILDKMKTMRLNAEKNILHFKTRKQIKKFLTYIDI